MYKQSGVGSGVRQTYALADASPRVLRGCCVTLAAFLQAGAHESKAALLTLQGETLLTDGPRGAVTETYDVTLTRRVAPAEPGSFYATTAFEWVAAQELQIRLLLAAGNIPAVARQLEILRTRVPPGPLRAQMLLLTAEVAGMGILPAPEARQALSLVPRGCPQYVTAQIQLASLARVDCDFHTFFACLGRGLAQATTPSTLLQIAAALLQADAVEEAVEALEFAYNLAPADPQVALELCKFEY